MDNRYYFDPASIERTNFDNNNTIKLGTRIILDKTESQHLSKVRRASVGDKITGFCGDGFDYELQVEQLDKCVQCTVAGKSQNLSANVTPITVFLATLKSDALNESVDALTQLNVKDIIIFDAKHSIADIDEDKLGKLRTKSIQACKQCERADLVNISSIKYTKMLEKLKEFDLALFAYEDSNNMFVKDLSTYQGKKVAVIIGCEGGFDKTEAEQLSGVATTISLGKTILRAPVACIASVSAVMSGLGEWKRN